MTYSPFDIKGIREDRAALNVKKREATWFAAFALTLYLLPFSAFDGAKFPIYFDLWCRVLALNSAVILRRRTQEITREDKLLVAREEKQTQLLQTQWGTHAFALAQQIKAAVLPPPPTREQITGQGQQQQLPPAQPEQQTTQAIAPVQPVTVQQPQQPTQYVDPKYAWADDLLEYPAILVYGPQGSGKTSFVSWLMQERHKRGHGLLILDPHCKYGNWKGLEVIGGGMDYKALDAALQEFHERITFHYQQFAKVPNYNPPLKTTLAEEFTNWASRCKSAGDFLVTAMSDIRKVNEHVVFVSHSRTMAGLGGAKGFAATRDESLLELNLHAQVDPVTKKAKPALRGTLKYPGGEEREVAIAEWMQGSMDFTDSPSPTPQPQQSHQPHKIVEVVAEAVDPKAYRYPANWGDIRSFTQQLTGRQCCFPGCPNPSTSVHHARYMVNGMSICNAPRPGEDIFPLCDTHHKDKHNTECAHHEQNWIYGQIQEPLEIDSRNTPAYHQLLREGFLQKTAQQMVAA